VGRIFDNSVLDLTFYEAGNSFWKAVALQGKINEKDAEDAVNILTGLREEVEAIQVKDLDSEKNYEDSPRIENYLFYIRSAEKEIPYDERRRADQRAEKYFEVEKID